MNSKHFLAGILTLIVVALGSVFYGVSHQPQDPSTGTAIATPIASFETSLAARISDTATSMTLVSTTTQDGTKLVPGSIYGFTLDDGTANLEYVIGYMSTTSGSSDIVYMTRGISTVTGTSSVSTLQHNHSRGSSVKISNAPVLLQLAAMLGGRDTLPNILSYQSGTACSAGSAAGSICDKAYLDAVAGQGAATSTESLGGIVELGTALEQASSTNNGVNQPTVLQTKNATSTPGYSCDSSGVIGALCAAIADNAGNLWKTVVGNLNIANTWSALQTFTSGLTANGAAIFNSTATFNGATTFTGSVSGISGMYATSTIYTSSGTWTKPTGATKVEVWAWGGGGGGGGGSRQTTGATGGPGSGGCLVYEEFAASDLSATETITIGAAGTGGAGVATSTTANGSNGTDGGDTTFGAHLTAGGGKAGGGGTTSGGSAGAAATCSPAAGTDSLTQFATSSAAAASITALPAAPRGGGSSTSCNGSNSTGGTGGTVTTPSNFHRDNGWYVQYPVVNHPFTYMITSVGGDTAACVGFGGGTAGPGNAGVGPGSGGGGGGGKDTDDGIQQSREGGAGAAGQMIVVTYF